MMLKYLPLGFITVIASQAALAAPSSQPAEDAAKVYLKAAQVIEQNYDRNVQAPSASNLDYPGYPPFSDEWQRMEKEDFLANAAARELAHQARSIEHAEWPALDTDKPHLLYLNKCRVLSNELADAALFQHLQEDDTAAIETLRDQLQLSDSLENAPHKKYLVVLLVSMGIRAEAMDRLKVVTSDIALKKAFLPGKSVSPSVVRELIDKLINRPSAKKEVAEVAKSEAIDASPIVQQSLDRCVLTGDRVNIECGMAAVSLACHLYRLDNNAWPKSLNDLHAYMPSIPVDPFGDGKQTLGYALIKSGLPDGSDRPLVYSRCDMKDGLFYRTDQPFYCYYSDDGSDLPPSKRKHGGQFRDIAAWFPKTPMRPATQPVADHAP